MSEWDRLEAEERRSNIYPFPGEPPAYMDDLPPYADEKPETDEPLVLIDPSAWTGIEPPVRRWKVKDYIPEGEATLLTGKGAAGKSLVSQLMCTCIALGLPFLGVRAELANTLYITCEDGDPELHRRQKAICEGLKVDLIALSGKLYLLSLKGELNNHLATFTQDGRMSVAALYRRIVAICLEHQISFIILDNTAHLFTGNENDRHQVASFINLCNRLAVAINGSVVIVGHPNKAGDSYSGSTAWENQVRSRLFMEIPTGENGEIFDPDMRVLRREKVNYAQAGGDLNFCWFNGTFILPDDLPTSYHELALVTADAKDNHIFLACLRARLAQRRAVSEQKASRTYAPKEMSDMAESKGIGRARLERAMDRLFRLSAIERGFLWVYKGEGKSCFGLKIVEENIPAEVVAETPMTPSDDLSMTSPMSSPMSSDNAPMTSDVTHYPPKGGITGGAPHGGIAPFQADCGDSDFGEPPEWMDEAPPLDPPQSLPSDDWHDNPILNLDHEGLQT